MQIVEQTRRHSFLKILDYYEVEFRTRVNDIENHMTDKNNPHEVTSDQVHVLPSVSQTVYDHIIDAGIHHYRSELQRLRKLGSEVKATMGKAVITTLKGTLEEFVFVNGKLMWPDDSIEMDYSIVRNQNYPPGPCTTEITFHDYNAVLDDDTLIYILYQEQL